MTEQAIDKQDQMEALLRDLDAYKPQYKAKKQPRKETFNNAYKLFRGREVNIDAFKSEFFPLPKMLSSFQEGAGNKDKEFILQKERPKHTVNELNKLIP